MLQNWPIRSKLVVILIVPLVALAVLSAIQVRGNVESVSSANRTKALAGFAIRANALIAALQTERNGSHTVIGTGYGAPPVIVKQILTDVRPLVDRAADDYNTAARDLPGSARNSLGGTLAGIDDRLSKLPAYRQTVDRRQATLPQDIVYYDGLINDLLELDARVASGSRNADLISGAATLTAISREKEAAAQVRGNIARIFFLQQSDPDLILQIQGQAGTEDGWQSQLRITATPAERELYEATVTPLARNVATMRDTVLRSLMMSDRQTIERETWLTVSAQKISKMEDVERRIATDLAATADRIATDATRQAAINSLAVALVLALSVLIALLVASPMIRQLRRLREGALEVADHSLPDVVERLHRGEPVDLAAEAFPVPATTRDEIGQMADAFSTVHEVAVRTAVEQAAMRKSIGDTFLNLARRSQALIHRQLKIIDALERKETDPDELEELFRLDHLATRMRRHAEDLIVLSGSKPARGWRRPVPIKDVIRGAVAEVEDYTRVKVLPVGGGAISGHAVGDVIHMLAEFIENATSFSPPHTPVHVTGHEVSNGFAIEIEDRGLGMNPAEFKSLNDRLENPPPFDLTTSERLGLFVVGRLAERHGIKVRLRTSPYGGTMAIVLIPGTLLRPNEGVVDELTPAGTGGGRELAAVGAGGADPEPLELGAPGGRAAGVPGGMLALPPVDAGPAGANGRAGDRGLAADEPGSMTRDLALPPGPTSGALALAGPAGTLDPGELPAPPPLSSPMPPVPPELPGDESGPRAMFGGQPPRGDDEPLLDDLPVFATVRSSWFIADRPRRDAAAPPADDPLLGAPAVPAGPLTAPARPARPAYPTAYSAPVPPPPHPADDAPDPRFGALPNRTSPRHFQPGGPQPGGSQPGGPSYLAPEDPPGPATPGGGIAGGGRTRGQRGSQATPQPTTEVGLPRRMRRANLAPELRRDNPAQNRPPQVVAGPRSPEEIRSMMSSFQSNFGRGLADAQGSSDGDDQRKVT
ncbi:nitrate- and nitrite sensing domain-containing protein [Pseudofrankia asymbiotica]|uniref:histidine kinase n=1 Tax=Pseudofrankia asymbiotica TaxID=1834516 RepID=A0A1V2IHH0_9ACTN|nr:nitrate- and nitrite sensing domain-containing protein [Pseudofrankia asymbiotica]ONH31881.1 histidine kinase [Pseudofrankia asymbiotica]